MHTFLWVWLWVCLYVCVKVCLLSVAWSPQAMHIYGKNHNDYKLPSVQVTQDHFKVTPSQLVPGSQNDICIWKLDCLLQSLPGMQVVPPPSPLPLNAFDGFSPQLLCVVPIKRGQENDFMMLVNSQPLGCWTASGFYVGRNALLPSPCHTLCDIAPRASLLMPGVLNRLHKKTALSVAVIACLDFPKISHENSWLTSEAHLF